MSGFNGGFGFSGGGSSGGGGSGDMLAANNLSEVTPATARTNLGLAIGTDVQAYDADTVKADVATSFTSQQNFGAVAITSTSNSIAWNLAAAQSAKHTFIENTTLANPTNMVDGGTYVLRLTQHASSPKTLAFGNAYKWPGGVAPTVTATNGAVDVLTFTSDGTSMFGNFQPNYS